MYIRAYVHIHVYVHVYMHMYIQLSIYLFICLLLINLLLLLLLGDGSTLATQAHATNMPCYDHLGKVDTVMPADAWATHEVVSVRSTGQAGAVTLPVRGEACTTGLKPLLAGVRNELRAQSHRVLGTEQVPVPSQRARKPMLIPPTNFTIKSAG